MSKEKRRSASDDGKIPSIAALRDIVFSGLDGEASISGILRLLFPIVGACLLSACATPHWVKPEATESDLAQERHICIRTLQEPPPLGVTSQQMYEQCMKAHGWKLQQ
jgi:hypothetical protein